MHRREMFQECPKPGVDTGRKELDGPRSTVRGRAEQGSADGV